MAIIVTIDRQEWLVDVGFGHFSSKPLLLTIGAEQADERDNYCIQDFGELDGVEYLSAARYQASKKDFRPVYIFTTQGYAVSDFYEMHHYHQTAPESHFIKNLICSVLKPDGRLSLLNNRLISTKGNSRDETLLYSDHAVADALAASFGVCNAVPQLKPAN